MTMEELRVNSVLSRQTRAGTGERLQRAQDYQGGIGGLGEEGEECGTVIREMDLISCVT
jgi:hypothetical protein